MDVGDSRLCTKIRGHVKKSRMGVTRPSDVDRAVRE